MAWSWETIREGALAVLNTPMKKLEPWSWDED